MDLYPIFIILLIICFNTAISAVGSNNPSHTKPEISINCGSVGISSTTINGREWFGDKHPKFASLLQIKGTSTTSSSTHKFISGDPLIYKTARISHSQFFYSFHLNPGQTILRLHFNPTPYKGFTSFKDSFTAEAAQFTLLKNFSASLTANSIGTKTLTKEFYISIQENQPLNLIFSPTTCPSQERTYAFVNGIEIISIIAQMTYFQGGDLRAQVVGQNSLVYVDNNTALELIHRLSVKHDSVSKGGEFDMVQMWGTVPKLKQNETSVLTWNRSVHVGFRYLIRVHFSSLGLKIAETGHLMFKISINELIVETNNDIVKQRRENARISYRAYLVVMKGRKQDGLRDLSISFHSNNEFIDGDGILKGFEILKVSNPDNSLATPNPLPPTRKASSWTSPIFFSLLGSKDVIATIATMIIFVTSIASYKLREISETGYREEENKPSARAERHCRRFSLAEIQSATRNFSDALFIGRGGFGKVYKGVIDNVQQTVAMKRLKAYSSQGRREFLTEIEMLSELRHINLVSLIGYCNERKEMILVYEYMTNGTLSDHLYKLARKNESNSSLTWKNRLNICIGAGRGLEYLHTGHRVIHRDVKPSNILLDENFIAKVADFGLAKPEDRSKLQSHVSTNVKGTFGYFDPYYISTHKLTRKSDVYAFGVVLFEVLCGRPAVDRMAREDERSLTKWAQNKINKGGVDEILDSSLIGEILPDSLMAFVEVAESCLHDEPKKRPTMAQVVVQLEFALEKQERRNVTAPIQETRVVDEVTPSNDETLVHADTRTDSKITNNGSPTENKDGQKLKTNWALRLWPWDATWKRAKPSKEGDLVSKALSEIRGAGIEVREFDFTSVAFGTNPFSSSNKIGDPRYSNIFKGVLPEIRGAGIEVREFDFTSIAFGTNQFSSSNKIGDPRYSNIFKGVLPTGQVLAVKRYTSQMHKFKNEILLLSRLQHCNIIKLLGYCIFGDKQMVVFEFMENQSLDKHIYDETRRSQLHWVVRFKIIVGIARGITYLHQDSRMRIIHRKINPCSILLDAQMNPKICNFSLTTVLWNIGFSDPGYIRNYKVSIMFDVYSFGILILETVSGKRAWEYPAADDFRALVVYAWKLWIEGHALDLVDESLDGSFPEEAALRCIQVGLLCTQRQPCHRPTMPSVLKMLC